MKGTSNATISAKDVDYGGISVATALDAVPPVRLTNIAVSGSASVTINIPNLNYWTGVILTFTYEPGGVNMVADLFLIQRKGADCYISNQLGTRTGTPAPASISVSTATTVTVTFSSQVNLYGFAIVTGMR